MSRRGHRRDAAPARDHAEHRGRWRSLADAAQDLALSHDWMADDRFAALASEASIARRVWTWAGPAPSGGICEILAVTAHRWGRLRSARARAALGPAVIAITRELLGLLDHLEAPAEAATPDEPGSPADVQTAPAFADPARPERAPTLRFRADIDG